MKYLTFIFLWLVTLPVTPQDNPLFTAPLDIPLYLSGTFGELRSDHFHSGIDIKTQGTTGHHVYAIEGGYVSRVKVRAGGYGKALYIAHPSGYTSVYGHLEDFYNELADYVEKQQYQKKTHEIDLYLDRETFPVTKEMVIGYSGNTGSSSGPHLHFEIRNSSNQHPLNVLAFDFPVEDRLPPEPRSVRLYPLDSESRIEQRSEIREFDLVECAPNQYRLRRNNPIAVNGSIGIGMEVFDFLNGSRNPCGVYRLELQVDNQSIYLFRMDEFSFSESRYINAHIDYNERIKNGRKIHRLFKLPHDPLPVYKHILDRGVLRISDTLQQRVRIIASDIRGNRSEVTFTLKGRPVHQRYNSTESDEGRLLPHTSGHTIKEKGVTIRFPSYAFYDDIPFTFARTRSDSRFISDIFHIHEPGTPVHKPFSIAMDIDELSPEKQQNAIAVRIEENGDLNPAGGSIKKDQLVTSVRSFGTYAVALDTIAPDVTPLNLRPGQDISGVPAIRFIVRDDLSGIQTYQGYLDNSWVLFEYDPKNELVFHTFDPQRTSANKIHELELYIEDDCGNKTVYHTQFRW